MPTISSADLQAYLDEALPAERMAVIEQTLREDDALRQQLVGILARRDAGVHSVGEIWRRHRLTCPPREEIGSFLLGILEDDHADYIRFHLETVGCRLCAANRDDLQRRQQESSESAVTRRDKIFRSTAGQLRRDQS